MEKPTVLLLYRRMARCDRMSIAQMTRVSYSYEPSAQGIRLTSPLHWSEQEQLVVELVCRLESGPLVVMFGVELGETAIHVARLRGWFHNHLLSVVFPALCRHLARHRWIGPMAFAQPNEPINQEDTVIFQTLSPWDLYHALADHSEIRSDFLRRYLTGKFV